MVGSSVVALLLGLAVSSAAGVPELNSGKFHQSLKRRPLGLDLVTDNVVPLKPVHSVLRHQKGLHRRQSTSNGGLTAVNNPSQANYVAEVGWGNETYSMILDTGSSDTWILKEGFQCLDSTGAPTIVRILRSLFVRSFLICRSKAIAKLDVSLAEISPGVRLGM
jgi:aspergillopepsin I